MSDKSYNYNTKITSGALKTLSRTYCQVVVVWKYNYSIQNVAKSSAEHLMYSAEYSIYLADSVLDFISNDTTYNLMDHTILKRYKC